MTTSLETERLLFRPFELSDTSRLAELVGKYEVAKMLLPVPYPYTEQDARDFILASHENREAETDYVFALVSKAEGVFIGCVELGLRRQFQRAELGYWVGVPYWGQGYMTEAARWMLRYGFEELNLNRIHSSHFAHNPASGRVMQKIGMTYEATFRQFIHKFDEYVDMVCYGMLKSEWQK